MKCPYKHKLSPTGEVCELCEADNCNECRDNDNTICKMDGCVDKYLFDIRSNTCILPPDCPSTCKLCNE